MTIPDNARALTVRQPWASLIALGVKTIETRSWSTAYRGPLVIHAGQRRPTVAEACALNEQWKDCPVQVDEYNLTSGCDLALIVRDDDAESMFEPGAWTTANTSSEWMPLGAVVAVVDLVDVVPIIDGSLGWTEDSDTPPAAVVVSWCSAALLVDTREIGPFPDLTDQLPFGDFTPGRFAWLLDNVRPIDPPIPAKGRQGLWRYP